MSEQPLFSWNFADGTLNGLRRSGQGTVTVEPYVGGYRARCATPLDRAEAASLNYSVPEQQAIRAVVDVEFEQFPINMWEAMYFLRVTHRSRYGGVGPTHPAILGVQRRLTGLTWRLDFHNAGAPDSRLFFTPAINPGQRYRVELIVSAGTNASIRVIIDGVEVQTVTNVDNSGIVTALDSVDFGIPWGSINTSLFDYALEIFGVTVIYHNISGLVVDAVTLQPIVGAGVRIGTRGVATDSLGAFTVNVPAGIYSVQILRTGYQTVLIENVDATILDVDLGQIALTPVSEVTYWPIRAVTIFPYWFAYTEAGYQTTLRDLRSLYGNRINFVELRVVWHADPTNPNNVVLFPDLAAAGRTSLESLAVAIDLAHANGFAVLLGIIHDNFNDPNWPVFPTPVPPVTDWAVWWQNYTNFVAGIAQFAQQHGVEALILGWEYDFMTPGKEFENGTYNAEWSNLLNLVRGAYNGLVTYEASHPWNATLLANLLKNDWWSNLDFIDISTYPPLTNTTEPSLAQLIGGWSTGPLGVNYIEMYREIATRYGKKIVINTAYPSYDGANMTPWRGPIDGAPDWEEQRLCWEAFFLAWGNENLMGVHIEHWDNIPLATDMTSGIREKPGAYTINDALASLTPPGPPSRNIVPLLLGVFGIGGLALGMYLTRRRT